MRKTLKELNLLDDFLFGTLLTYPELGEKFSRALLQTIFQREFGKLTVIPQKIYYGSDTDQHGARLDVYMEEEDAARVSSVYDVEPDQSYDDRAKTIYLYTKGTRGNPSKALQEFLHYIEETTWENAVNPMVVVIKSDKEVSLGYMKIFEREEMLINMGREEERANTEQQRLRADQAEEKIRQLEALLKEKN